MEVSISIGVPPNHPAMGISPLMETSIYAANPVPKNPSRYDLGKFHHDLTVLPSRGIMVYCREIIPKWP